MLELVAVLVLLLVEVDEIVRDPVSASAVHLPADPERVTGHMTDPDVPRDRQVVHVPEAPASELWANNTDISAPQVSYITVPCNHTIFHLQGDRSQVKLQREGQSSTHLIWQQNMICIVSVVEERES